MHGRGAQPNRLILGRSPDALRALEPALRGKVALAYLDPPFDTGHSFDFLAQIPGNPAGERVAVPAFHDDLGLDGWVSWFHQVAANVRELLAPGGSLYVHLDATIAHYAKVLLDEIFGRDAFQREIIWRIGWVSGYKSRARGWIRNHDTILFYAKGGRPSTFHKEYLPYPAGYARRAGPPGKGNGYPLEDVWNANPFDRLDSIQLKSFTREKVGYPTQKNEALVARIVRASSGPGDLVLDAFVGSGTTAAVAEKLGRAWVVCDAAPAALFATRKRLLAMNGRRPFVVESLAYGRKRPRTSRNLELDVRATIAGRRARIELRGARAAPRGALAGVRVEHWSQWVDAWCIDWNHHGGPVDVETYVHRSHPGVPLELEAGHAYRARGDYRVVVRAFDVIGGQATTRIRLAVR